MEDARKVALITGANKGIGLEVARQIARAGWTVLAAARNEERGQKAAEMLAAQGLDVRFIHLDVSAHETAKIAAELIGQQFGKLDLLINNAGIVAQGDAPPSTVSLETLNALMQTNYIGAVAVTQAMLPLLRRAGRAQVINVSSELGSISLHADPNWKYAPVKFLGYCASKAALNMFTVQLAYEFRDGGIAVNSINPGYTATDLNNHSGSQTVEQGAAEIIRVALLDGPPSAQFLESGARLAW